MHQKQSVMTGYDGDFLLFVHLFLKQYVILCDKKQYFNVLLCLYLIYIINDYFVILF